MPGEDDVGRILAVLRNLGEPAEVVADRLPDAMVRSGATRNLPLYIMGGILIAMFGIPLGLWRRGSAGGFLPFALAGIVIAYYATAGSILSSRRNVYVAAGSDSHVSTALMGQTSYVRLYSNERAGG